MNENVFTVNGLKKRYKKAFALNGVDMEVKRGDIYGFVGENGAGKTTLIRILAGLATQTEGELSLFGKSNPTQLVRERRRIGGMVEAPVFFPDMTAMDNMEIIRLQKAIPDKNCIQDALQLVGLTETGKKRVKNFSFGMKQRLGLAMALMGEPEFLVFDEPFNGLDRTNIIEFREALKRLNREQGTTILLSSHTLSELYQIATCYGFLHKGKILEQISADALAEKCKEYESGSYGFEKYYMKLIISEKKTRK